MLGAPAVPGLAQGKQACANPDALGLARTVEVDTTGGPGFGFEQYKLYDFLVLKEVVLTFDDGPWPTTHGVLEALAQQCVKATFFPIGRNALAYPEILKEVAAAGHTVGGHTWSHANLAAGAKSWPRRVEKKDKPEATSSSRMIEEIEKGFSAVKLGLAADPAPFFRFPYLKDPKEAVEYLGSRNIAIFSHDLDSFDFKMHNPEDVVKSVMTKLERKGKGIILMHDAKSVTAKAIPTILSELKAKGYKVVHMRAKAPLATLPQWDEVAKSELKGNVSTDRPVTSVIRTIEEEPTAQALTAGANPSAATTKK
jgi:peptidoglycan/xylan/chitin deacetylase (PgdA/CDA1 family)